MQHTAHHTFILAHCTMLRKKDKMVLHISTENFMMLCATTAQTFAVLQKGLGLNNLRVSSLQVGKRFSLFKTEIALKAYGQTTQNEVSRFTAKVHLYRNLNTFEYFSYSGPQPGPTFKTMSNTFFQSGRKFLQGGLRLP